MAALFILSDFETGTSSGKEKKMKPRFALIIIIILAFSLSACATQATAPNPAPAATSALGFAGSPQTAPGPALDNKGGLASQAELPATAVTRLVVKNANLTIVVENPAASMATILNLANPAVDMWSAQILSPPSPHPVF